tara:strand:- start:1912 stop:3546 length:1635 start_codon:yes stop_codon:yes gene_type:complete
MVTLSSLRQQVETQQGTTGLDSSQVSAISGSGVSVYETLDSLPTTGLTAGDEAFVKSSYRLYVSNGLGWYNTTLVNRNPRWDSGGEPDASYSIVDSATPLIITARAIDSDNGSLINQSIVSDSAQYMATISNDSSVWTFTPKTASQIGASVAAGDLSDSNGDFIYTFKWSDGISVISKPVTIAYSPAGGGAGFSNVPTESYSGTGALRSYTSSVTGQTFYYSGGLSDLNGTSTNAGSRVYLTTNPGATFYIAMVGAGGGTGRNSGNTGGNAGMGVAQITVPPGVTGMTIFTGGGGIGADHNSYNPALGGIYGGGAGGTAGTGGLNYDQSQSGGGFTGLFKTNDASPSFSNVLAIVGGGGGCGVHANDYGGGGGGFNMDGTNGRSQNGYTSWSTNTNNGLGESATTSAGGRAASRSNSYHGTAAAGTALQGGAGASSQYDAGGGGGGGYYGGGGGGGGGGYDGGSGGGGSGYADLTYVTIMDDGGTPLNQAGSGSTWDTTVFESYVQTASGATDFTYGSVGMNTQSGRGENTTLDRNHGQFVLWG